MCKKNKGKCLSREIFDSYLDLRKQKFQRKNVAFHKCSKKVSCVQTHLSECGKCREAFDAVWNSFLAEEKANQKTKEVKNFWQVVFKQSCME